MRTEDVSTTDATGNANGVSPAERLLLDIIDTVREPLLVLDSEFRVTHANRAFFQTFRVAAQDTIGEVLFALGDGQWDIPPLRALLRDRLAVERELYDVDVDHVFPAIGRKIMLLNARLVRMGRTSPRIILLAIEDVTERRLTERRLAAQRLELAALERGAQRICLRGVARPAGAAAQDPVVRGAARDVGGVGPRRERADTISNECSMRRPGCER